MIILKYVLIAGAVICALAVLLSAMKTKRPLRTIFASAVSGIITLIIIIITGYFTGVTLAVNAWTLLCAAAAGIPGVVLMLVMKMIWNV